jgi:hypothetical protein
MRFRSTALLGMVMVIVGSLLQPRAAAGVATCGSVADQIMAAFARRLARDTGNLIGAEGVDISLVTQMSLGLPAGTAGALHVRDKTIRVWGHTYSKVHRKCTDAQASANFPGGGHTVAQVVDNLFNRYGLPWVEGLRDLARSSGAECAQYVIVQAGYAARDAVRHGRDHWQRYEKLVDQHCPHGLFHQAKLMTASYLDGVGHEPHDAQ